MRPVLATAAFLIANFTISAQTPSSSPQAHHEANFDSERAQANQLYLAGKRLEALPFYEDLCRQDQANPAFAERHGMGLIAKVGTVADPAERNALMTEGNKELLRAESLGDHSPAVEDLLGTLAKTSVGLMTAAPMGGLPLTVGWYYSGTPQAQQAMQRAELAYGHGDYAAALPSYIDAANTDPKWYTAALYTGDTYFRLKDYPNANLWFARAIAIDPDRETAYRYWGDTLMRAGDTADARLKFEQALTAEPYNSMAFSGLRQWAIQTKTSIIYPQVRRPEFTTPNGKLAIDPSLTTETGDGHASWLLYQQSRVAHGARTSSQFIMSGSVMATTYTFVPKGYVHNLAEEREAITVMLADVQKKLDSGAVMQARLEPSLKTLLQLQKDNMLEPFILLSFNDAGIRHGYPEYRAAHRDQIVTYIDRYLIGPPLPPNTPSPYVNTNP